jgi:ATP-dependent DNA ligase
MLLRGRNSKLPCDTLTLTEFVSNSTYDMSRRVASPPSFIAPQVPILSREPPSGTGWLYEIKHDGFRTLLRLDGKRIQAFT